MEVVKKINNNAAVCIDSAGNEIVAIGTGIGFPKTPYVIEDLSKIQRTYYDINPMYLDLLNQIPEKVFFVSAQIVELFRNRKNVEISSNLVFTLADHINFAIERVKKNIKLDNTLQYELQHLYTTEYNCGLDSLDIIEKELFVKLPKEEASNIALHLINYENVSAYSNSSIQFDSVINDVVKIINENFDVPIDKTSVSFSRFVSHFKYLLRNNETKSPISSDNYKMFKSVTKEYPSSYEIVLKIKDYLQKEIDLDLSEEELLYLIIHVNRLCVREDCYHNKGITQ